MRKFVWFVGIFFAIVVGGVFAAPSFIDWNQYKGQATQEINRLTGRNLDIAGKVHISLWPAPALVAEDITFSNAPGGQAPNMASLKAVEVRIALAPLFAGRVQVETVKLIEPVIELEKDADGHANWEFDTPAAKANDRQSASSELTSSGSSGSSETPDIALDNFVIENGTIIYRDATTGTIEPVESVNATISAASLQGPMETSGSLVLRGIPLTYSVSVGQLIQSRTVPFNAELRLAAGGITTRMNGTLVNILEEPAFKGQIDFIGKDLNTTLKSLGMPSATESGALPTKVSGTAFASAKSVEISDLRLDVSGIQATGDLQLDLTEKLRFGSQIAINRIDVDSLIEKLKAATPKPDNQNQQDAKKQISATEKLAKKTVKQTAQSKQAALVRFELPKDVAGSFILTADAIGYRGGVIRDLALNAELAEGTLSIGQISAQLPGGSDAAISGQLSTPESVPTFNGAIETTVNDLRGIFTWLEMAPPPVPADRLRKIRFNTNLLATPEQIQATGIDLRFDSSRLQGGVTVAIRKRLGFGAAVVLDRLNIDAYMPGNTKSTKSQKPANVTSSNSGTNKPQQATGSEQTAMKANPLAALNALNAFDANFNVHIKSAVYSGAPVKDLVAEGTLYGGNLDLKRLSIGKLAGASANITGKLSGLNGVPSAKNLAFRASIPDASALSRLVGVRLPVDAKKLGAMSLKGQLDGNIIQPNLKSSLSIAGASIGFDGRLSPLSTNELVNGHASISHKNIRSLLSRLGVAYRPAGRIGGFNLKTTIKAGKELVALSGLSGAIGKTAVGGSVIAKLTSPKPHITADLKTGALNIEQFLPAKQNAAIQGLIPQLVPAAWRGPQIDSDVPSPSLQKVQRGRWSIAPLDLSALNLLDADINVKAPILIYGRYLAENADIGAKLSNGVLDVNRLQARLFGGALTSLAKVNAVGNTVSANAKVTGLNVEDALKAVTGEAGANGKMDVNFNVASGGGSIAALVKQLGGKANFQISDMDVSKATQGSLLTGLLGLFTSLNQLGGGAADQKAAVGASFDIRNGIATTRDLKINSSVGNGGAAGAIDLPNWTVDLKGEVALAETLLTRLLKAKVRETRNAVPFAITGSLEAPNVKIDTGAALGAGVPIPGADALLNKAPKGVGTILRGILGGGTQQQSPSSPPSSNTSPSDTPPPPPDQSNQGGSQQISPEKLLKQLFKL